MECAGLRQEMLRVEGRQNRKRRQENCYILWEATVLSGCLRGANDRYMRENWNRYVIWIEYIIPHPTSLSYMVRNKGVHNVLPETIVSVVSVGPDLSIAKDDRYGLESFTHSARS